MDIEDVLDSGDFEDRLMFRLYQDLDEHFTHVTVNDDGEVIVKRQDVSDPKDFLGEVRDTLDDESGDQMMGVVYGGHLRLSLDVFGGGEVHVRAFRYDYDEVGGEKPDTP